MITVEIEGNETIQLDETINGREYGADIPRLNAPQTLVPPSKSQVRFWQQ